MLSCINLFELPWNELAIRDFFETVDIVSFIWMLLALYIIIREIFRTSWMGKRIMRIESNNSEDLFKPVLYIFIPLLIILIYGQLNYHIKIYKIFEFAQEFPGKRLIMFSISRTVFLIGTLLLVEVWCIIRFYGKPEIREKGIMLGLRFFPWGRIASVKHYKPGTFIIYFRKYILLRGEVETVHYLEIKPEQDAEIIKQLQKYIPDSVT